MNASKLTQADLVVLSLLLEQPMHGYDKDYYPDHCVNTN